MSVFEKGRPIKITLHNFCSGLLCTKVASTGMIMIEGDDIRLIMLRYTPPDDLAGTILEQIRIILEKGLHHG